MQVTKTFPAKFAVGLLTFALSGLATVPASGATAETRAEAQIIQTSTPKQASNADFWFQATDGLRTFTVDGNTLVPQLIEGDELKIEGNLINTYNSSGELVGSIKAEVPDGVVLQVHEGVIFAGNENGTGLRGKKCIDNKWVSLSLNVIVDGLVCRPLGVATGGVGGFVCGAAAATGTTALSC